MASGDLSAHTEALAALLATPCESSWKGICRLVDRCEEPDEVIDRAQMLLARWPQALQRPAPWRWLSDMIRTGRPPHPGVALADTLVFAPPGFGVWSGGLDAQIICEALEHGQTNSWWRWLAPIQHLHYRSVSLHPDDIESSGQAQRLLGARTLSVRRCGLEDDHVPKILAACEGLERLNLAWNRLTDAGLTALSEASTLSGLRHLDWSGNSITAKGARSLARAKHLADLQSLVLRRTGLDQEAMAALVKAPWLKRLQTLELDHNPLTNKGLKRLARALPPDADLERLGLAGCDIGPPGIRHLVQSASLARLAFFRLDCNTIGDEGLTLLARETSLDRLSELLLAHNGIGLPGLQALTQAPWSTSLRRLSLGNRPFNQHQSQHTGAPLAPNRIDDQGATLLANALGLAQVTHLDLGSNQIGERGARALGKGELHALESLRLQSNPISEETLQALEDSNHQGADDA